MKIKPEKWTHHHAHRLYHLSMSMCFGVAALVMATGMGTFLIDASAFDVTDTENLTITATVAGINPGPTEPTSTSGSRPPVSTAFPTVTIKAEPLGQIPQRNITVGGNILPAYVFETVRPTFSGTTSVPNGIIFLYIEGPKNLNTTARASLQGDWIWQSPDPLPYGVYSVTARVYDSYDLTRSGSTQAYFVIQSPKVPVEPGQPSQPGQPTQPGGSDGSGPGSGTGDGDGGTSIPLPPNPPVDASDIIFGVFYEILPEYETVETGGKLVSWVTLVSNTGQQISNQNVNYQIISPLGKVVLETQDTISFSGQVQFLKTFNFAPLTPTGTYTIRVSSTYEGVESVASAKFNLKEPASASGIISQGPAVIWSLLVLLLILFLVLFYIAYRYVRHHTRLLDEQNRSSNLV